MQQLPACPLVRRFPRIYILYTTDTDKLGEEEEEKKSSGKLLPPARAASLLSFVRYTYMYTKGKFYRRRVGFIIDVTVEEEEEEADWPEIGCVSG